MGWRDRMPGLTQPWTSAQRGVLIALVLALERLRSSGLLRSLPITGSVAAVSVGIVDGRVLVDLAYAEDSRAEVDLNVVMTGGGRYVEVQGTAEGKPFTPAQLDRMLAAAQEGIRALTAAQRATLAEAGAAVTARA